MSDKEKVEAAKVFAKSVENESDRTLCSLLSGFCEVEEDKLFADEIRNILAKRKPEIKK